MQQRRAGRHSRLRHQQAAHIPEVGVVAERAGHLRHPAEHGQDRRWQQDRPGATRGVARGGTSLRQETPDDIRGDVGEDQRGCGRCFRGGGTANFGDRGPVGSSIDGGGQRRRRVELARGPGRRNAGHVLCDVLAGVGRRHRSGGICSRCSFVCLRVRLYI